MVQWTPVGHGMQSLRSFLTVSWQKDGSPLRSDGRLLIRAEGERHTLLLREARAADAGSYTATATNELGQASCAATLAVRPGREPVGPQARGGGVGRMSREPSYSQPRAQALHQRARSVLRCQLLWWKHSKWPSLRAGAKFPKAGHFVKSLKFVFPYPLNAILLWLFPENGPVGKASHP